LSRCARAGGECSGNAAVRSSRRLSARRSAVRGCALTWRRRGRAGASGPDGPRLGHRPRPVRRRRPAGGSGAARRVSGGLIRLSAARGSARGRIDPGDAAVSAPSRVARRDRAPGDGQSGEHRSGSVGAPRGGARSGAERRGDRVRGAQPVCPGRGSARPCDRHQAVGGPRGRANAPRRSEGLPLAPGRTRRWPRSAADSAASDRQRGRPRPHLAPGSQLGRVCNPLDLVVLPGPPGAPALERPGRRPVRADPPPAAPMARPAHPPADRRAGSRAPRSRLPAQSQPEQRAAAACDRLPAALRARPGRQRLLPPAALRVAARVGDPHRAPVHSRRLAAHGGRALAHLRRDRNTSAGRYDESLLLRLDQHPARLPAALATASASRCPRPRSRRR
jgi:hypothetical protein